MNPPQQHPHAGAGPDRPTGLGKDGIAAALKRTVKEFRRDHLTIWAAALTFYGVLSIFPGPLVAMTRALNTGPNGVFGP